MSVASCCEKISCGKRIVVRDWDELWKRVADPSSDEFCAVLDLDRAVSPGQSLKLDLNLKKGLCREVELRFLKGLDANFEILVKLAAGSCLAIDFVGELQDEDNLNLDFRSVQEETGSQFVFRGRVVSGAGSAAVLNTSGYTGGKAFRSDCEYDLKVLQIGKGGIVNGFPVMETLCRDVKAVHGFSVGRVPDDVLNYLGNRGLTQAEAENLYKTGFLKG